MKPALRRVFGTVAGCLMAVSAFGACSSGSPSESDDDLVVRPSDLTPPPTTTSGAVWPEQAAFCNAVKPFAAGAAPMAPEDKAVKLESMQDLAPLTWRTILGRSAEAARLGTTLAGSEVSEYTAFTAFVEANCGVDIAGEATPSPATSSPTPSSPAPSSPTPSSPTPSSPTQTAAQTTPDCVTEKEYAGATVGSTTQDVGTAFGLEAMMNISGDTWTYMTCDRQNAVVITYKNDRLADKKWVPAG